MPIGPEQIVQQRTADVVSPQPILFVHGMWDGACLWDDWIDYFSTLGCACSPVELHDRQVLSDPRQIGRISFNDYLDVTLLAARTLHRPVLVGHSLGGLLALKAAEHLDPVAVVAVTPAAPRGIFGLRSWQLAAAALKHAPKILFRRPLLPSPRDMMNLKLNGLSSEDRERIYARQVPASGRQLFDTAVMGIAVDASKIHCPVLVVGAAADRLTPPAVVRKVAQKYAADYREYEGRGHMIVIEPGYHQLMQDVAHWLQESLGARLEGS